MNKKIFILVKSIFLVCFTVIILAAAGCGTAEVPVGDLGNLRGYVTDAVTGERLDYVYVLAREDSFDRANDYTDRNGEYRLELGGGIYDVYFEKEGYYLEKVYNIVITAPFSRTLNIKMTPSPSPTMTPNESLKPSAPKS